MNDSLAKHVHGRETKMCNLWPDNIHDRWIMLTVQDARTHTYSFSHRTPPLLSLFKLPMATWSSLWERRETLPVRIDVGPCIKTCRLLCVRGRLVYGLQNTRAPRESICLLLERGQGPQPEAKEVHYLVRNQPPLFPSSSMINSCLLSWPESGW